MLHYETRLLFKKDYEKKQQREKVWVHGGAAGMMPNAEDNQPAKQLR